MSTGLKKEVRVFTNSINDLNRMTREINEYLNDKPNAEITYHNVSTKDAIYVIATVKVTLVAILQE